MIDITFTLEEEKKAQEIDRQERARMDGKRVVAIYADLGWVGKIGEWAFSRAFPTFLTKTQNFSIEAFDFLHPDSWKKTEIKTNSGKYPFARTFGLVMDLDQWNEKPYEIIVFAYYELPTKKLTLVGWNYRVDLEKNGKIYKHGERLYNSAGRFRFEVHNKNGCIEWNIDQMRPIEAILTP